MSSMTFIEHDGTQHVVDTEPGLSVMQIAINNNVPGIDADCGGQCACGTCHVIIEGDWGGTIGRAGDEELQMLDLTPERVDTSRLACQLTISETMDGLVVRLPEFQM